MITPEEMKRLKELASKSSPNAGERKYFLTIWNGSATSDEREADAAYIAAANPQTILSLISRIEELEREQGRLMRVIANDLSENDELGAEYTYVNALKSQLQSAREVMTAIADPLDMPIHDFPRECQYQVVRARKWLEANK